MAIGLRSTKCQMSIYPTREERRRWAAVARAIQRDRQLEKFSLSDMARVALREFVQRHATEDGTPAQDPPVTRHA